MKYEKLNEITIKSINLLNPFISDITKYFPQNGMPKI